MLMALPNSDSIVVVIKILEHLFVFSENACPSRHPDSSLTASEHTRRSPTQAVCIAIVLIKKGEKFICHSRSSLADKNRLPSYYPVSSPPSHFNCYDIQSKHQAGDIHYSKLLQSYEIYLLGGQSNHAYSTFSVEKIILISYLK